ncbi:hypothetical protein GCM10011572_37160 [Pseudoduganella buxea]|uniref:Uncharacterized protein n=1 Tax=Pseudoduganella buxea TaxID=1949069 RepID=A0ABQ1L0M7_9BURK|nr:hypothetical protein GCM10011572_37160 [Pseudoduganella buxea]
MPDRPDVPVSAHPATATATRASTPVRQCDRGARPVPDIESFDARLIIDFMMCLQKRALPCYGLELKGHSLFVMGEARLI